MQIHEFSTGIQVERTSDGGWVSKGFTGDYMNKTLSTIPSALRDAITNREFAVAEGAYGSDPAIIGREVSGYGEDWSVVAVVTKGRDDRGRSASLYRYFLAEGCDRLDKILVWMNQEEKQGRGIVFDPFAPKRVGQPNESRIKSLTRFQLREDLQGLLSGSAPAIVPAEVPCKPLSLNEMAKQMAHYNRGPIAWAFKVEALEQPRMFQVIQPGSDRAEDLLRRALASQPRLTTPIAGEQAIKNAVKGLIRKVKPDALLVLDNALGNPAIEERFWEGVFNGQGADKARSQGLYSEQMVKLLTLRGMILPETLPEFVQWMKARSGKQEEHWEICSQFQSEVFPFLQQTHSLAESISDGVRLLIPWVVGRSESVESVVNLLTLDNSIWGHYYSKPVRKEIDNDLNLMSAWSSQQARESDFKLMRYPDWKQLLNDISIYWKGRPRPRDRFEPLGELFYRISDLKISMLFHQIGSGEVPGNIFDRFYPNDWENSVYGIRVRRKMTWLDSLSYLLLEIGTIDMKMMFVLPLLAVSLTGGVFLGNTVLKLEKDKPIAIPKSNPNPAPPQNKPFASPTDTPSASPTDQTSISTKNDQNQDNKNSQPHDPEQFKKTHEAIQIIIKELVRTSQNKYDSNTIQDSIILNLKDASLPYLSLINRDYPGSDVAQQWVYAIQQYQQNKGMKKIDGVINANKRTSKMIKCDVAEVLDISLSKETLKECQQQNQRSIKQNQINNLQRPPEG